MAEALGIVSIVSSIVQLVDFGSKVLERLHDYQIALKDVPGTFRAVKRELPILLDTLKQTQSAEENDALREETKRALLPVVEACVKNVKDLGDIVDKNLPGVGDSWRKKSRKAIASFRLDKKVDKIVAEIQRHIHILTYYHAASLSTGQTSISMHPVEMVVIQSKAIQAYQLRNHPHHPRCPSDEIPTSSTVETSSHKLTTDACNQPGAQRLLDWAV